MTRIVTLSVASALLVGVAATASAAPAGFTAATGPLQPAATARSAIALSSGDRDFDREPDRRDSREAGTRGQGRAIREGTGPGGFADRRTGTRFVGGVDVNRGRLIGNIPGGIGATGR
jgi:hypothetical protein